MANDRQEFEIWVAQVAAIVEEEMPGHEFPAEDVDNIMYALWAAGVDAHSVAWDTIEELREI